MAVDGNHGLVVTTGSGLQQLVDGIAAELDAAPLDLFDLQLVVTPGPAHQRLLSQTIATGNGHGVCAGIDFVTIPALRRRLQSELADDELPHPDDDPWSRQRLARVALQGFDAVAGQSWARALVQHLQSEQSRPGRRLATAARVARLARRYCRDAPTMIDAWDAGRLLGPEGNELDEGYRWQAHFWQVLTELAAGPHPLRQQRLLLDRVAAGRPIAVPERLHLLVADALHPQDVELVRALAGVCLVHVWQLDHTADGGAVLQRLARVHHGALEGWAGVQARREQVPAPAQGSGSVLGLLQSAVHGHPAVGDHEADDSVRFLPSHGPTRQVEVLRDHLCGLFEDDPTLEPRDVAVLCPDLDAYSSALDGAIVAQSPAEDTHPGRQLRVRVSHDRAREPNQVLALLDRVLALRAARATWQDLFDLCLSTPVAERWGFDGDGGQQVKQLLARADIRWGLDRTHRQEFGIGYDRGTWLAGVEALALGAALADSPVVEVGRTAPAPFLDSQSAALAGQLAEFVSRLRKFFHDCQPATARVWNERLQALISDLVTMPASQRWQVAAARAALSLWAGPTPDETLLGRADVRQVLAGLSREQRMRPSFGTGALVVTEMGDLTGIPHRVVVLLGLDDSIFPRKDRGLGDDLLAGRDLPGVPTAREVDQQHLLNAVMAAGEKLVVVYQAQDPTSLDTSDQPVAITELLQAAAAAGVRLDPPVLADGRGVLPAQSFARSNFLADDHDGHQQGPFSFDRRAHRAVAHLDAAARRPERLLPQELALYDYPVAPHPEVVRLQDLERFFSNPAQTFLSERARLRGDWDDPMPTAITLESDGLAMWQVRSTIVERLRLGEDLDTVVNHQYASGVVPPTAAGRSLVNRAADDAATLVSRLASDPVPHVHEPVQVEVAHPQGRLQLVGSVLHRAGSHLVVQSSRISGHHVIRAWLNALALSVATGRPPRAVFELSRDTYQLSASHEAAATSPAELLSQFVALYVHGLTHPLLAPPRTLWQLEQQPHNPQSARDRWAQEQDQAWLTFLPQWWDGAAVATTCSAGHDGGCARVSVSSMAHRLFGSTHLGVL